MFLRFRPNPPPLGEGLGEGPPAAAPMSDPRTVTEAAYPSPKRRGDRLAFLRLVAEESRARRTGAARRIAGFTFCFDRSFSQFRLTPWNCTVFWSAGNKNRPVFPQCFFAGLVARRPAKRDMLRFPASTDTEYCGSPPGFMCTFVHSRIIYTLLFLPAGSSFRRRAGIAACRKQICSYNVPNRMSSAF